MKKYTIYVRTNIVAIGVMGITLFVLAMATIQGLAANHHAMSNDVVAFVIYGPLATYYLQYAWLVTGFVAFFSFALAALVVYLLKVAFQRQEEEYYDH